MSPPATGRRGAGSRSARSSATWPSSGVDWKLAGSNEDSAEAGAFLINAFGAAIFLIFLVLLAQFNKFTSVLLVLTCVVMA